ncbi:sensor histidine kinase [Rathayibacter soli]|uniref:sensor histidine kinase n=1 Tax=Rathayibacter soli TaxID=3144168 RepID=UPI0027E3D38E|nr:histidine kinase [Glaciibacter superstes]
MSFFGDGMLGRWIGLAGFVIVSVYFGYEVWIGYDNGLAVPLSVIALLGWLVLLLTPPDLRGLRLTITLVAVATGAISVAPTNGLMIAPVVVCVMTSMASVQNPPWIGPVIALVAAGLIALGALTVHVSVVGILAMEAGVAVALLAGFSRRQTRIAIQQQHELLERTVLMREEQTRADVLTSRQELAREIHDVLAHSLGGLVIQLDATDALLESGRVDEAAARVRDARALAASGLGEARRAIDALRDPDATSASGRAGGAGVGAVGAGVDAAGAGLDTAGAGLDAAGADVGVAGVDAAGAGADISTADISTAIADLVAAHQRLGGPIRYTETGEVHAVAAATAVAFRRTAQESLSNARKHAPGALVTMELAWHTRQLTLTVSNELVGAGDQAAAAAELAASGGGNGLRGMRERFDALPGGRIDAQVREDSFVISAEADLL